MRYVLDHELDTLGQSSLRSQLCIAFLGIFVGGLISFAGVLATVNFDPTKDAFVRATFIMLLVLCVLGTIFSGGMVFIDYQAAQKKLEEIRKKSQQLEQQLR